MSPAGGETSNRNIEISYQLQTWSRQNKLGIAFDSSGGFKLPNNANRSPDAAWIPRESWDSLTEQQGKKFLPLCPDPENRQVIIYRQSQEVGIVDNPQTLSGEDILPGFVLQMETIW
jgi:Uma2 family endonuclease